MSRIFFLSALVSIGIGANTLCAQETVENELEFVRKLRDKGWADLAKTKIEELVKRGDPALNAALPLELAEINIAMARQLDPEQRLALFTQARTQLQDFIKQNQGKGPAALASVKLARLTSYQAQAILSRAMREEETKERHAKARPAEAMFIQAGQDLEAAIKAIDAALPNATGSVKGILEQEKRQARFDIAVNLFDQAKTYVDRGRSAVNEQRSLTMDKARKAFFDLRSDESSQNGWLANAWLMKCAMELTVRDDVILYHKKVMDKQFDKTSQPAIQPAVRLVKYFYLQDLTLPRADEAETIGDNAIGGAGKIKMSPLDRLHKVQKDGEDWLKSYANYQKTYEGQGVRFEVGQAYLTEAYMDQDKKDPKSQAATKKLFDLAADHFKILGSYDGDLAARAQQLGMSIQFKAVAEGKIELKSFDQFYMKAMIERGKVIATSKKMDAAKPDEQKKIEGERKQHLKEVINALNNALALADTRTPIGKVDDARYFLCGACRGVRRSVPRRHRIGGAGPGAQLAPLGGRGRPGASNLFRPASTHPGRRGSPPTPGGHGRVHPGHGGLERRSGDVARPLSSGAGGQARRRRGQGDPPSGNDYARFHGLYLHAGPAGLHRPGRPRKDR